MERLRNLGKILNKTPIVVCKSQEFSDLSLRVGSHPGRHLLDLCWVSSYALPGNEMSQVQDLALKSEHFEGFKRSPASRRHRKTDSRLRRCSSNVHPSTIMSSRYTRQCDHWRPARTRSMSRWKVAGALQSPNGMTLNWKRPSVVQRWSLVDLPPRSGPASSR